MRIRFERSGGFAGMRLAATVDTESLPPGAASDLRQMVQAARVFELPAVIAPPTPSPDQFCYKLTIEAEGRQHTIETCEPAVPEALRPLLRYLTTVARSGARPSPPPE